MEYPPGRRRYRNLCIVRRDAKKSGSGNKKGISNKGAVGVAAGKPSEPPGQAKKAPPQKPAESATTAVPNAPIQAPLETEILFETTIPDSVSATPTLASGGGAKTGSVISTLETFTKNTAENAMTSVTSIAGPLPPVNAVVSSQRTPGIVLSTSSDLTQETTQTSLTTATQSWPTPPPSGTVTDSVPTGESYSGNLSNSSGRRGGMIAGITVGLIILGAMLFLLWKYRRSRQLAGIVTPLSTLKESIGRRWRQRPSEKPDDAMAESLVGGAATMGVAHHDADDGTDPILEWKYDHTFVPPLPVAKLALRSSPLCLTEQSFRSAGDQESAFLYPSSVLDVPPALQVGMTHSTSQDQAEVSGNVKSLCLASTPTDIPQSGRPLSSSSHRQPTRSSASSSAMSTSFKPLERSSRDGHGDLHQLEERDRYINQSIHSYWSLWFRNSTAPQPDKERDVCWQPMAGRISGTSTASSSIISPSLLSWPMPSTTTPSSRGLAVAGTRDRLATPVTHNG